MEAYLEQLGRQALQQALEELGETALRQLFQELDYQEICEHFFLRMLPKLLETAAPELIEQLERLDFEQAPKQIFESFCKGVMTEYIKTQVLQ